MGPLPAKVGSKKLREMLERLVKQSHHNVIRKDKREGLKSDW